ncbi:MAG TPA: YhjD/YihY/BrkB family envelope integrity protein, partial [Acidimicrobiia bacterium]|nr:YhjD/YihY/BrkB family envelope integrity protein [Acidimicrobiia bacterium]
MELFPVRVWRHFLSRNGFLLTAGMSYQSLFAVFAAVYVVFAVAGLWFFNIEQALDALVLLINTIAPGLVGDDGVITTATLEEISTASTSLFGWTGAVALAGLIWTAIGWVTYTRMAVRSIFSLPKDTRSYVLLKARDLVAALAFGAALLVAAVLSIVATGFLGWLLSLVGFEVSGQSPLVTTTIQWGALVVVFVIDTLALAVLFRFLSGAQVAWRRIWRGSLLGSIALSLLQLLGGTVLSFASGN